MTTLKAVRGTRDLLPPETALWNRIEATARALFARYNFGEIRTPVFEDTALFARGAGVLIANQKNARRRLGQQIAH